MIIFMHYIWIFLQKSKQKFDENFAILTKKQKNLQELS